ncbi:DNA mismatch repair endonuclease MutL [Clostridiisalibacter paucivorans]|uniref:DNA mismatch repair endonuclease MutL n=1 Tax=Clostridiisalibacter paucivorans TaxID=408753 RepID=UPI00047E9040|nr:DNA mismatch repair endonuclease MutL [Clostridiisalibacter paucivorans]
MTTKINILDDTTINKIAAGEVIENPSSIVKELVENSIDAGSKSIIIEVKNGGKTYIRVTDNGTGIDISDINLVFLRHTTSKIKSAKDLEKVMSLGFRGEALASIAAVSHVQMITKTKDALEGIEVNVRGGKIVDKNEVGCPSGTTIVIKNLFYNTPVRKKYLKTEASESSKITDIVYKLSLAHPEISFKYIRDNKMILKTSGNNDIKSTIYDVFGKDIFQNIIPISYKDSNVDINGFISNPSYTRGNRKYQYFFVNDRYVRSKMISKAIEEGYKELLTINRYPVAILCLKLNPETIDVNIHPSKLQIRFQQEELIKKIIYNLVHNTIKNKYIIPEIKSEKKVKKEEKQTSFIDIKIEDNNSSNNKDVEPSVKGYEKRLSYNIKENNNNYGNINIKDEKKFIFESKKNLPSDDKNKKKDTGIFPNLKVVGVIFSTYILGEDLDNKIFYIIDQHAAHERIMYEKYKEQYLNEHIVIQNLLAPEVIDVSFKDYESIINNIEIFKRLGFIIEDFGGNNLILRGVPMIFGKPNSKEMFMEILDNIRSDLNTTYDLKIDKIMKLACTNSIKGGDRIQDIEIKKLINDLSKSQNPFTCPHGRPIIIKMTKYELEKKFKRIQ